MYADMFNLREGIASETDIKLTHVEIGILRRHDRYKEMCFLQEIEVWHIGHLDSKIGTIIRSSYDMKKKQENPISAKTSRMGLFLWDMRSHLKMW